MRAISCKKINSRAVSRNTAGMWTPCILLILLALLCIPFSASADGLHTETVRVGYYEKEVFQEGARQDAVKTGYAYEYYRKLSEYTGWKYEYVYGEYGDLYQKLLSGEIDLLAGLARTEDRMGLISYPDDPMGNETYNLVKHDADEDITTDPATYQGRRIGILDSAMVGILNRYLEGSEALAAAEQANRAKTVFLNNMSHDIRTPMNAIVGFTNLAKSHVDDRGRMTEYLEKISVSSRHLLFLINDVLDMSRIESGKMRMEEEEVKLPELIRNIRSMVQPDMEAKQLKFQVEIEKIDDENIITDRLRLNQILLNILSNAVKFTPEGGTIRFGVSEKPSESPDRAVYEFRIADNGIGMSEEFRKTIFEAFTRERTTTASGIQGTGLGMAITKNIVDMMGGTIEVASTAGKGSVFAVTLPFRISQGKSAEEPQTAGGEKTVRQDGDVSFAGKRVLLAEDNALNQQIAQAILENVGFAVEIAGNGKEALELIEKSVPGRYDIVLMDIQMPVMDGYEAAGKIRALEDPEKAGIPIVAVTANVFEEDRQNAFEAGMNGHLAKPYDVPEMMKTLTEILG